MTVRESEKELEHLSECRQCARVVEGCGDDDGFSLEKDSISQPPYFVLDNDLVHHLLWAVWYSVLKFKEALVESWLHLLLARTSRIIF